MTFITHSHYPLNHKAKRQCLDIYIRIPDDRERKKTKEKNDMVQLLMFFLYEVEMLRVLFWRPMILGSKGTNVGIEMVTGGG